MNDELQKQVAADLGIAAMTDAEQKKIIAQFGEVALRAATMAVMDHLSDDKRTEFMTLAQGGDAQEVQAFLDREVPDHETLARQAIAAEIGRFKDASPEAAA